MRKIPKIVWTIHAREDIESVKRYVKSREGNQGVERLKRKLRSQLMLIQQFPLIGMATPDRPTLRKFRLNGHQNIVYEPRGEIIVIHAILPYWMKP